MSVDREALREAVARALAWHGTDWRDCLADADEALAAIIPACQEAAMPPPLSDPATPDHMTSTLYQAGRIDAADALAAFLPEKTDAT